MIKKEELANKQTYYSTNLSNRKNLKLGTTTEKFYHTIPAMK